MTTPVPTDSPAARIAFYERKFQLGEDMDAVLEQCFKERKDLASAVGVVFNCLARHLAPEVMFLRTFNEELVMTTYTWGVVLEVLAKNQNDLFQVASPTRKTAPGMVWFAIPLDMAGETVGCMGLGFAAGSLTVTDQQMFELMNVAAEELDSYFYGIQDNRRKHEFILEVQRSLASRNLSLAITTSIGILLRTVPIQDLLLLYFDEDLAGRPRPLYLVFRDGQKLFDAETAPLAPLDRILGAMVPGVFPENDVLAPVFPLGSTVETLSLAGSSEPARIGRLVINPAEGAAFSIFNRELLQVFAESLRQRLVDFNRERTLLRGNFSPEVTTRLLEFRDYRSRFLASRTAEIGLLVVDICGFSKVSEVLMPTPDRLSSFIDGWSAGVLDIIFREGGSLDKMVGDSLVALFGPPFYDTPVAETVARMMRAALAIRSFSREFYRRPEFRDLQAQDLIKTMGVAIGLNHCQVHVGLMGPTRALTAIGMGMVDTLRLQDAARRDEILVTPVVKEHAEAAQPGLWTFSGPHSVEGKAGSRPLACYRLTL
ncbi:MAG: adenylate/guanylate cyclase domain-containing protein [Candidatus Riflebacteria bacterium]|nr:adenylate/guanylate cyclase domain-containing protein [Candidatus Riflebacteria bacterium]